MPRTERATPSPSPDLELWGGVECTINRVGDVYHDQLRRSGHAERPDDLDRFAALGLRALRYPVLWEQLDPDGDGRIDWGWADERLGRLRELGVRPIVGLCHHGSGPRHTHLLDPAFPAELARFARLVSERYPWVDAYTPVNEPLTTARFAALYGHWYPHARDGGAFFRALVNQCRAVALAMREIRAVNPAAQLVQTEDLGQTHATPELFYQAEFENDRRWLSLDLLHGRLGPELPIWKHYAGLGFTEADLDPLRDEPCPPDLIGINTYVTSERFLDHRIERYPAFTHGSNGRHVYADVEAVRVLAEGPVGPKALLRQVWERYGRPLAVTEAHLGSTRAEQLRWLWQVWREAGELRTEGVALRAVTVWSLLGAFDWHCLLTRREDRYEPGAFDVRAPRPRPTAIAKLAADLGHGREPNHPALARPGWWRRPERLLYPPVDRDGKDALTPNPSPIAMGEGSRRAAGAAPGVARGPARPILILGDGALARRLARSCAGRALPSREIADPFGSRPGAAGRGAKAAALRRRSRLEPAEDGIGSALRNDAPSTDDAAEVMPFSALLDALAPWAVIDASEPGPSLAAGAGIAPDARAAGSFAAACARRGIALVTFSSALVFDGAKGEPYVESDAADPDTAKGHWQAARDVELLAAHPGALVIRTGPRFDAGEQRDFLGAALDALARAESVVAEADRLSPVFLPDLVEGCLDLLVDGEGGLWHLSQGASAYADLLGRTASLAGLDPALVVPERSGEPLVASARNHALASERGWPLPKLDEALERFVWDWRHYGSDRARSVAD